MPLDSADITVVLNGHREGILIHRTLRGILRAVDHAREQGLRCEIVVVLDRPDRATADYFARGGVPLLKVVEVDFGDTGLARNRGVAEAGGAYVALVDGDDLICRNWLADAFAFAEQQRRLGRRPALHPEANIFFGEDSSILLHVDQESPEWSLGSLFAANYWTALVFAGKDDLIAVPYRASAPDIGFGYEDWDWNCLAVAAGLVHKVVPSTWHFIRLKGRGSRNQRAQDRDLLVRPSPLFERLETEPDAGGRSADEDSAGAESGSESGLARILDRPELLAEWRELAGIEPALFPTRESLRRYRFWKPARKEIGEAFGRILRHWGTAPTHVILCNRYGGGDDGLAALNYARALVDSGADVLVIAEEWRGVGFGYGDKGSLRVLDFGAIDLEPYWRTRLLAQALIQRPAGTVHLIGSGLGYEALACYGPAIAEASRIYLTIPVLKWSAEGGRTGPAVSYFDRIAPHLAGLLSSNRAVLSWICDTYGYPEDRCHKLCAVPYSTTGLNLPARRPVAGRPRAVWVGDDGSAACPAMLLRIAKLTPTWDFVMSFSERPSPAWADELEPLLLKEPNIVRLPPQRRCDDAMQEASALLHTSLIDGLPAAFFEASLRGLPIVAPGLAAIREFVDEETGYPVEEFFRPEAYAERLRELLGRPEQMQRRVARAQQRVRKEYSWRAFVDTLQSIDGNRCAESARPAGLPRER